MKIKYTSFAYVNLLLASSYICLSYTAHAAQVQYSVLNSRALPNLSENSADRNVVVKARATINLHTDSTPVSGEEGPVNVTLTASTTGTLDTSGFISNPTMSNAIINFGTLRFSSLQDNDLNSCGGGSSKCVTALFRMYTINTAEPGFYSSVLNFSAPISAGLPGTTFLPIGLTEANAAILQTYSIPSSQQEVNLSDFSPLPIYDIIADFRRAGAGSYTTTLVLEYATE